MKKLLTVTAGLVVLTGALIFASFDTGTVSAAGNEPQNAAQNSSYTAGNANRTTKRSRRGRRKPAAIIGGAGGAGSLAIHKKRQHRRRRHHRRHH